MQLKDETHILSLYSFVSFSSLSLSLSLSLSFLSYSCFYGAIGYLIVSPVPPPVAVAGLIAEGCFRATRVIDGVFSPAIAQYVPHAPLKR